MGFYRMLDQTIDLRHKADSIELETQIRRDVDNLISI
jgi:hypothetical protein